MTCRLFRTLLTAGVIAAALIVPRFANGQGLTGQISGTVADAGGGVMPGATVTLKDAGTNATRDTITAPDGTFVFPDLLAGTYDISVSIQGFKTYEQKSILLGATERVALRTIALEVGGLQETVTVTSEGDARSNIERCTVGAHRARKVGRYRAEGT